jgi:predicted DNA-binding protein YlxM (UPF0122 family)
MSRITSWTDDAKQDFLRWLGKGKYIVEFLTAPKVAVTIGKESGTYCVETSGMGFVLRDEFDVGTAVKLGTENSDEPQELTHKDIAAECAWSQWSGERQKAVDELIADVLEEYVPVEDHAMVRGQITEAIFAVSNLTASHLLSEILGSVNPALSAWAMALTFNLSCAEGHSQTEIAKRIGVTRSNVSKAVKEMQAKLAHDAEQISRYTKSASASVVYSDREKLKQ